MNEPSEDQVPLKEHLDAILNEKDRALSMADGEREKAASALRGEQQRALDQAGRERDKAAENLRIELARAMNEGDDRLREHISQQVLQINAALVSAEKLEVERVNAINQKIEGDEKVVEALRVSFSDRIDKFETSVADRFKQVNEFRGSLDDLGKQMATRRELEGLSASLNQRHEELVKTLGELRSRIDVGPAALGTLQQRIDTQTGQVIGAGEARASTKSAITTGGAILAALATLLGIFTTYQITKNSTSNSTPPATVTQTVTTPAR